MVTPEPSRGVQATGQARPEATRSTVPPAVDADDLDVLAGLLTGRGQRGDGAQGHLVVLRVDAGDFGVAR